MAFTIPSHPLIRYPKGPSVFSDPYYMQVSQLLGAQGIQDQAQTEGNLARALVNFGEVPSGVLSPQQEALWRPIAQQTTAAGLSQLAQLQKQAADARRGTVNDLAGRGILQSGEAPYQLGQNELAANQQQYSARSALLDYIAGIQQAFAQNELARKQSLIQAQFDTAQRLGTRYQPITG